MVNCNGFIPALSVRPRFPPIPRIHAIRTADDDGSEAAVQTPDQIEKMVNDCNNVYSSAGIQFVFDKQKDFEFIRNSLS